MKLKDIRPGEDYAQDRSRPGGTRYFNPNWRTRIRVVDVGPFVGTDRGRWGSRNDRFTQTIDGEEVTDYFKPRGFTSGPRATSNALHVAARRVNHENGEEVLGNVEFFPITRIHMTWADHEAEIQAADEAAKRNAEFVRLATERSRATVARVTVLASALGIEVGGPYNGSRPIRYDDAGQGNLTWTIDQTTLVDLLNVAYATKTAPTKED